MAKKAAKKKAGGKKKKAAPKRTLKPARTANGGKKKTSKVSSKKPRKLTAAELKRRKREVWEKHLKAYSWKPGQSGNLKGRPPGTGSLRVALRRRENEPMFCTQKQCMGKGVVVHKVTGRADVELQCPDCKGTGLDKDGRTFAEFTADQAAMKAAGGNMQAIIWIGEQLDGKPPERIELEGDTGIIDVRVLRVLMSREREHKKLRDRNEDDEEDEPE